MSKDYVMQLEATIANLRRDNALLKELNAKYKGLEEQLGCPLEAREQALEKGFFDEKGNHYTCEHYVPYLKEIHTRGIMTHTQKCFKLKDYKKTWWLRKDMSE